MKINEFYKFLNEFAPIEYSNVFCEKYGAYDNSGILVDTYEDINSVVFSLDLTLNAVLYAKEVGAKLIVTHHPAIYKPISSVNDFSNALLSCINEKIGVISMHLNLDSAPMGIDHYFCQGIGGENAKIVYPILEGGYGRVFTLKNTSLSQIKQHIESEFNTNRVLVYGLDAQKDYKVASFCGGGLGEKEILSLTDCDLFISSDIPHHVLLSAINNKKSVINLTHYASEFYGYEKIFNQLKNKTKVQMYLNNDKHLL